MGTDKGVFNVKELTSQDCPRPSAEACYRTLGHKFRAIRMKWPSKLLTVARLLWVLNGVLHFDLPCFSQ